MKSKVEINGLCESRFQAVKDTFARNFEEGMEVGASFAVTINGEYVIDIWGGYKDRERTQPWEKDTISNVYSTTKVPTVLCTMMCVDRGLLDLDEKVAKYWPEFAQNGKEGGLWPHRHRFPVKEEHFIRKRGIILTALGKRQGRKLLFKWNPWPRLSLKPHRSRLRRSNKRGP